MKKMTWLFVLMMVCGALFAQSSKEIFDAALVPKAPLVIYADGTETANNPFAQNLKKFEADFQAVLTNGANKFTGENAKSKEFWESVKGDLKLEDDDIVKWQLSVAIGGMQFGAGEPDFGQLDILLVAELKKALTPEQVKNALLNADKKCGDGDAADKADFVVAERNGAKLFSLFVKETDETAEIPNAFRRLHCGFVGDGKILVAGVEKSVYEALKRIENKTAAEKHPYIARLFNDNEKGFLALGMLPQLQNFLSNAATKGADGDPNKLVAKAFVDADGISFTTKLGEDKLTISLNMDMAKSDDAAMLKGQVWDAMVSPMLQQVKPMIIGQLGGELPLLDTLKCVTEEKRTSISFDMKEADVKSIVNAIKAKQAAQAPEQPKAE